jgi:hypothetical protein
MFLNIRLLIVALFASIVVLSCELGVFAAFAVSPRPLTHMPTDSGSLLLVSAGGASGPARTRGAPVGTGMTSSSINTERTASNAPKLTPFRNRAVGSPHAQAASAVSPGATFVAPVVHASPAPDGPASLFRPQQAVSPEISPASTIKAPAAGVPAPPAPKPLALPGTAPNAPPAVASAKSASTTANADTVLAAIAGAPVPTALVTPTDVTGSTPDSATTTSTGAANAVGRVRPRTRKPDRKARRRIAAAKRLIGKKPAPTARLFVRSVRQ